MAELIGEQAVVIGAGLGGLTAAAALAEFFSKVIVLERDTLPEHVEPRAGCPQGKHAHALLAGGQAALELLFPGFENDLAAAGAVRINVGLDVRFEEPGHDPFPQRDLGIIDYAMSRPLLEHVARTRVMRIGNVDLRANCVGKDIIGTADGNAVTGVLCQRGDGAAEVLAADLVVDASGRGAPSLDFLKASGQNVQETSIGVDIRYSSAIFAVPPDAPADWKGVLVFADPRIDSRSAVLLPMEAGRWILSLYGAHGDAPPGDVEGILAFARSLRTSTIYDAIRNAEIRGEIARFAFPASARRHFERVEAFPRGLLPVADTICRFNPAFGQGMSVAAREACVLRQLLRGLAADGDPLARLAPAFLADIEAVIATPWAVANMDFVYPRTRGERPVDFEGTMKFMAALGRLAAREPPVHKLMTEVRQLLKPLSVYNEPAFAQRVMAEMASV